MLEDADRQGVDPERHTLLGLKLQGDGKGGADGTAMGDGDDVAAFVFDRQAVHDVAGALDLIGEAFASRRPDPGRVGPEGFVGVGVLFAHLIPGKPLPIAEVLFAQVFLDGRFGKIQPGVGDGLGGLDGTAQMAGDPHRALGQGFCQGLEPDFVGNVAIDVV